MTSWPSYFQCDNRPFVRGIHQSLHSPHKWPTIQSFSASLLLAWIGCWVSSHWDAITLVWYHWMISFDWWHFHKDVFVPLYSYRYNLFVPDFMWQAMSRFKVGATGTCIINEKLLYRIESPSTKLIFLTLAITVVYNLCIMQVYFCRHPTMTSWRKHCLYQHKTCMEISIIVPPGSCIIAATRHCHNPLSQWQHSFQNESCALIG